MNNLERGVDGVSHNSRMHELIQLYLHSLLTLGAAVEKQDPIMAYYPKMKELVIKIASKDESRIAFFQELLLSINSHSYIKYGSKSYVCS